MTVFRSWDGPQNLDSYGDKTILDYENEPVFAELAILRVLQSEGWEGVGVDSFWLRFCVGIGKYPALPPEREALLRKIYAAAGKSGGSLDVYAWKGDHVLFAESKPRSHDRIRKS
jgi:hypothetical protein